MSLIDSLENGLLPLVRYIPSTINRVLDVTRIPDPPAEAVAAAAPPSSTEPGITRVGGGGGGGTVNKAPSAQSTPTGHSQPRRRTSSRSIGQAPRDSSAAVLQIDEAVANETRRLVVVFLNLGLTDAAVRGDMRVT